MSTKIVTEESISEAISKMRLERGAFMLDKVAELEKILESSKISLNFAPGDTWDFIGDGEGHIKYNHTSDTFEIVIPDHFPNVPKSISNKRKRFILAHEIGHVLMHQETMKQFSFDSYRDSRIFRKKHEIGEVIESEAELFAYLLLVPEMDLKKEYADGMLKNNNDLNKTITYLSDYFEVTPKKITTALKLYEIHNNIE